MRRYILTLLLGSWLVWTFLGCMKEYTDREVSDMVQSLERRLSLEEIERQTEQQ